MKNCLLEFLLPPIGLGRMHPLFLRLTLFLETTDRVHDTIGDVLILSSRSLHFLAAQKIGISQHGPETNPDLFSSNDPPPEAVRAYQIDR